MADYLSVDGSDNKQNNPYLKKILNFGDKGSTATSGAFQAFVPGFIPGTNTIDMTGSYSDKTS
jgi:hypothetical protein